MPSFFHPKKIFLALEEIDAEAPSHTLNRAEALYRVTVVLTCTAVCLILIHYLKYSSAMVALLQHISALQGNAEDYWLVKLNNTGFSGLASYCWWTLWHVLGYILLPWIVIRFILKLRMRDLGWRFNDTFQHWRGYLLLLSPILVFIFLVSFREDFLQHYPFYKQSGRSYFDLIAWEVLYLTQFICLEFFFRGFLLQALRPAVGANAIFIMCIPYMMIHFPKLWLEATGAIFFGLFLGILALRSRSIWGGLFVHACVAVGMDLTSMLKQGTFPIVFWPFAPGSL